MQTGAHPHGLAPREWLLAALLVLAFLPALAALAGVWMRVDYQSHGFLVPVVSAWVALRYRPRLARLRVDPDRRALLPLGASLLAYLLGAGAGLVSLQGAALVVAVAAAVWLLRGGAWLRALAFPIGFLVFMVPVPPSWITPTIVKLQLGVSQSAVWLLGLLGQEVAREGNVLRLANGETLFVAEACSGVTSIVTLFPLGILLGYLTLKRFWSRALLAAAVVPLAMAGNLTRVVATCLAAERVGAERATSGTLHDAAGLLTYGVACGLMLVCGALLRRLERSRAWTSRSA